MGARPELPFAPRLLSQVDAAAYIGVSVNTLRDLPIPRRELRTKRMYDRMDLDRYVSDLPYEGEGMDEESECDRHFGLSR